MELIFMLPAPIDYGFKRWGDVHTNKSKVLLIGDSFTQMYYVLNGQEYYSYLEKAFPEAEFFVFGGTGYGTLQEYMVLNDTFDLIEPDMILWQFCKNDLMNNLHSYEIKVGCYNNGINRPYLENGEITYKKPRPLWLLRKYSRFFDYALWKYDEFIYSIGCQEEENKTINYPDEQKKAYDVTKEIFSLIRDKTKETPIVMFEACLDSHEFSMLCDDLNITCIYGLRDHLQSKEKEGIRVTNKINKHWNENGNKLVGEYLAEALDNISLEKTRFQ